MHVGMNRLLIPIGINAASVPHARGDEPTFVMLGFGAIMRSPCTWG